MGDFKKESEHYDRRQCGHKTQVIFEKFVQITSSFNINYQ